MSTGTVAPPNTPFASDETVAGRFRIRRYLASGGMGDVYEAVDELLQVPVALKTLRAHVADDANALERFRREILFARQVTHPNVCRIFDVFQHRGSRDPNALPVTFLTMELLGGETLAERLRRDGRMSTATALPIVSQMVSALAAAHRAGVVHRDVKCGNVMLVPSGSGAERVVITDFGLAHTANPMDPSSNSAPMVGTFAYMAPEQVSGGTVTPAADIYALGVVVYEMVTGAKPFVAESPIATALQRLTEPPAAPSTHVPALAGAWDRSILRCLEREPAQRFSSVEHLLATLSSDAHPLAPAAPRLGFRSAAGVAVVTLTGILGYYWSTVRTPVAAKAPVASTALVPRRAVAVLGFKSLSGRPESAWLSAAFAEMLATELSVASRLRTIPGEKVTRMKVDLGLLDAEALGAETLTRIHANLGADLVVLGSYLAVAPQPGGPIRIDLRIQDAIAGETLASISETGTEAQILELVARCGRRVRTALGAEAEPDAAVASARHRSLPSNPEAVRLYTQGLEKLRLFDPRGAAEVLAQAADADPAFPLARLALSEAWTALGYEERARGEARRAFEAARELPREERLAVEARYRESNLEWSKAVEIYRVLFGFFPDDVEYGLKLASCQLGAEAGKDAMQTLEALRRLPLTTGDAARVDLTEASAAQFFADYRNEQTAAARAAARAELVGARLLAASARDIEAWALLRLGELDRAELEYESARKSFEAAGDKSGVARVVSSVGLILRQRGDIAGARTHHEQALALFREVGNRGGTAWALNHVGIVAEIEGDTATARSAYAESLATFREIGSEAGVVLPLIRLATVALQAADIAGARERFEEALAISRKLGAKALEARALKGLGDVLAASGELPAARQRYDESVLLREGPGDRSAMAESQLGLALVDLAEGKLAASESAARKAAEEFDRQRAADFAASAHTVLAQALIAQKRLADADHEVGEARRWAGKTARLVTRLTLGLAEAGVAAARGEPQPARAMLGEVVREAEKSALPAAGLEATLALARIDLAEGAIASGTATLASVRKRATALGLGLIVRKTAAPPPA